MAKLVQTHAYTHEHHVGMGAIDGAVIVHLRLAACTSRTSMILTSPRLDDHWSAQQERPHSCAGTVG